MLSRTLLGLAAVFGGASAHVTHTLVIDAGSSGSRLLVFEWKEDGQLLQVEPENEDDFETEPGLSSYASNPADAGASLGGMINAAKALLPADHHDHVPLVIKATAGVRSVEANLLDPLVTAVEAYMSNKENCPFAFSGFDVLAGDDEAGMAWIAVNTITKAIGGGGANVATAGILELGGSSMQIAFAPESDIFQNKFTFYVNNTRKYVYVRSFAQFGLNDMVARAKAAAVPQGHNAADPVDFACFNTEYNATAEVDGTTYTFVGTGDAAGCSAIVESLLGLDVECLLPNCAFYGQHISPIPVDKAFYGISAFFFVANGLGLVGWNEAAAITPRAILEASQELCAKTQTQAEADSPSEWKYLKDYCMAGLYMHKAFTTFGFGEESTGITFARKINGQNAGWALGAAVYEAEGMPRVRAGPCVETKAAEGWPLWMWLGFVVGLLLVGMVMGRLASSVLAPERSATNEGAELMP